MAKMAQMARPESPLKGKGVIGDNGDDGVNGENGDDGVNGENGDSMVKMVLHR